MKEKGKDLEFLCGGMIRNLICLKPQRSVKTNQDIIDGQCIRNDDGVSVTKIRKLLGKVTMKNF